MFLCQNFISTNGVSLLSNSRLTGKVKGQTWSGVLFQRSNMHPSRISPTCNTERAVIAAEDKDLLLNKR